MSTDGSAEPLEEVVETSSLNPNAESMHRVDMQVHLISLHFADAIKFKCISLLIPCQFRVSYFNLFTLYGKYRGETGSGCALGTSSIVF